MSAATHRLVSGFHAEVATRLQAIAEDAAAGDLNPAVDLMVASIRAGGVLQAFGTGHSAAFAMEIAGRAGGFIPSNAIALRDLVLRGSRNAGSLGGGQLERDDSVADEVYDLAAPHPADVFLIASNSGVNGSVVGVAARAKAEGHPVIAVTSLEHTAAVTPRHPSGKRLSEIADVVVDNRAPYGDTTMELAGGIGVGAVSSMTAAFVAQLLTVLAAARLAEAGEVPPIYVSANVLGGDEHNQALEERYGSRIRRSA